MEWKRIILCTGCWSVIRKTFWPTFHPGTLWPRRLCSYISGGLLALGWFRCGSAWWQADGWGAPNSFLPLWISKFPLLLCLSPRWGLHYCSHSSLQSTQATENICYHCQKWIYPPWTRGTLASYCIWGKQFINVTSTLSDYSIMKTWYQLLFSHIYTCSFFYCFYFPSFLFLASVFIIWTDFYDYLFFWTSDFFILWFSQCIFSK